MSLARAKESDIRRAYEAVRGAVSPRLHVFLATSDIHMKYKLCMSKEDVLNSIHRSVTLGKSLFPTVQFSAEDATRTSRAFLAEAVEIAIRAGANVINIRIQLDIQIQKSIILFLNTYKNPFHHMKKRFFLSLSR